MIISIFCLQASHVTVAQVACDSLLLLCDKADVLLELYPNVPSKIIQVHNIKLICSVLKKIYWSRRVTRVFIVCDI